MTKIDLKDPATLERLRNFFSKSTATKTTTNGIKTSTKTTTIDDPTATKTTTNGKCTATVDDHETTNGLKTSTKTTTIDDPTANKIENYDGNCAAKVSFHDGLAAGGRPPLAEVGSGQVPAPSSAAGPSIEPKVRQLRYPGPISTSCSDSDSDSTQGANASQALSRMADSKRAKARSPKRVANASQAPSRMADYSLWTYVLDALATEVCQVYRVRTGQAPQPTAWFARWASGHKQEVLFSLTNITLVGLSDFKRQFPDVTDERELLVMAGRLLARLLDPTSMAYSNLRAWFAKAPHEFGWISGLKALGHSNLSISPGFSHLVASLDNYLDFLVRHCKLTNRCIVDLMKPKGSKAPMGWNLAPLGEILRYSYLRTKHPISVLTVLYRLEKAYCEAKKYTPNPSAYRMAGHLPALSEASISRMPRYDEHYFVQWQMHFGLDGDVKLPDKLQFGWDFTRLAVPKGCSLIAISEGGQAIYQNARGEVLSEGHPVPIHPVVQAWGGPQLKIWMTKENCTQLLPFWLSPPASPPWTWYERYGNGLYGQDGQAYKPDPKFRPPVTWLEATGYYIAVGGES